MSDPLTGSNTLEQWTADALTVMDAVGSERAAFFGNDHAGSMVAMMCAATHPERVTRLVLYNGVARFLGRRTTHGDGPRTFSSRGSTTS